MVAIGEAGVEGPRGVHGQGRHHADIQGVELARGLVHAAERHRGVGVEGGHGAAGLLRDGREEGGLVSHRGGARGGGELGDPVRHDRVLDHGHQTVPWLRGLGDPVKILQVFCPITCKR